MRIKAIGLGKNHWTVTFYKSELPDLPKLMDERCDSCPHYQVEKCMEEHRCINGTAFVVEEL